MPRQVSIIGAGLVGSLLAVYLARQGHKVHVFERRGDPRAAGYAGGRSINLALSARGLWGMAGVGLEQEILKHAIPMRGRIMHAPTATGDLVFQPYSKNPEEGINSISRGGLNLALLHAAGREPNVSFSFHHRCLDMDLSKPEAVFVDETPGRSPREVRISSDIVAGADGAFSPVRLAIMKTDRFDYSQSYLAHGYKELVIPPAAELPQIGSARGGRDGFALEPNALHIWPRGGAMMIALPNPDRTFTCTLFWPFTGQHGLDELRTADQVLGFFREHYPDAVPLMPTLTEDYLRNPSSSLVTVRCAPWYRLASSSARATVLLGDAAHAIVPFYGQGMNCGFEDARIFAECLERNARDLAAALAEFHTLRKPNADAIADMALENFVEMRDRVGSRDFLYRKRIEHALHELDPANLTPQYHLVSFTTVPYADAQRQGRKIERIVDRLVRTLPREKAEGMAASAWLEQIRAALPAAMADGR